MARRTNKHGNPHTDPLTRWAQRLSMGFFLAITFAVILFSKAEIMVLEKARIAVADALSPVLSAVSLPVQAGRDGVSQVGGTWTVWRRNEQLTAENRRLREWQELARHLQAENAQLRAELAYVDEASRPFIAARVVADSSGAFARSVLINAGARQAIDRDQPVVAGGGLVGRVATVGSRSARVLLLTDLNSRVPVTVGDAGERAIAAGNNSDRLSLEYVPDGAVISIGDRVTTSGDGSVFPPGLAVGTVTAIGETITVRPQVDYATLTHVRILQGDPVIPPSDPESDAAAASMAAGDAAAPLADPNEQP